LKKALLILVPLVLLAGAAAYWWSARDESPRRGGSPNILFVSIDSLRADHVSCYGYAKPTTPHLDRLAAEGVRFHRALANAPWTLPSHITMLTGQEVGVHNVLTEKTALADSAVTIAEVLRDHGYRTIGVASAPYLKSTFGFGQGFQTYDEELAQVDFKESHEAVTAKKAVNKALDAIKKHRRHPWFVFLHLWDVHYDYTPPAPFDRRFVDPNYRGDFPMKNWEKNRQFKVGMDPADFAYVLAQYDGEVAWVDEQLGRLFTALREWGLDQNTIVVVTSDHGDELLDHGQKGHGHSLFDELVWVPLIVKGPGAPAGRVVDCPVGLIDLYPAFLEWAGVEKSQYSGPGRSLVGQFVPDATCDATRELFAETRMSNLDKLYHYKRGHEMMIEVDRYKYHNRVDSPLRELLYNVRQDPLERADLLAAEPDKYEELKERMDRHQRRNGLLRQRWKLTKTHEIDEKTTQQLKELGYIQ
jgi:arylsulfatase A-like enzyme